MKFHACILAGGTGTRLWPISRKNSPKQVKPFMDNKTLLQKTHERLLRGFEPECIWVATNVNQKDFILDQLPDFNESRLILEPDRRDTAAAIGLAALLVHHADPTGTFIAVASDHHIVNESEYAQVLMSIGQFLQKHSEYIVTIGIAPTYPETGYGYIRKGKMIESFGAETFFAVQQFTEKPDELRATQYIQSGEYLWNSGLFAAQTSTMLDLYKQHAPEIYKKLIEIQKDLGTPKAEDTIRRVYPEMQKISIDFAVIEKAKKIAVVPAHFGWSDVGNWNTLYDLQEKDDNRNITKGEVITIRSQNNIIYAPEKKVIGVIGVEGLVVIDTHDALLICPRDQVQDVKKIVEELEKSERKEFL